MSNEGAFQDRDAHERRDDAEASDDSRARSREDVPPSELDSRKREELSPLEAEERDWHGVASALSGLASAEKPLYENSEYRARRHDDQVAIDESIPPEALARRIEIEQYQAVQAREAGQRAAALAATALNELKAALENDAAADARSVLDVLARSVAHAAGNFAEARSIVELTDIEMRHYQGMLFAREGFESADVASSKSYKKLNEANSLRRKPFGSLIHRKKIKSLTTEYREGMDVLNKSALPRVFDDHEVRDEMRALSKLCFEATVAVAKACKKKFHELKQGLPLDYDIRSAIGTDLRDVYESDRDYYQFAIALLPHHARLRERSDVEAAYAGIWKSIAASASRIAHHSYSPDMPKAEDFAMEETGRLRNAVKHIDPEKWASVMKDERVSRLAGPEAIDAMERIMGRAAASELEDAYKRTSYDENLKQQSFERMLAWGGHDVAELALVEGRAKLHHHFHSFDAKRRLIAYARRLGEADLEELGARSRAATEVIGILRDRTHGECFDEQIDNPDFIELVTRLRRDRDVLEAARDIFKADELEAIAVKEDGEISGRYEGYGGKAFHIVYGTRNSPPPGDYPKGGPEFEQAVSSIAETFADTAIVQSAVPHSGKQIDFEPASNSSGWQLWITPKRMAEKAAEYGLPEETWHKRHVANPTRKRILDGMNELSMDMFERGDDAAKMYVLQNLKDAPGADTSRLASWARAQSIHSLDNKLWSAFSECAVSQALAGNRALAWEMARQHAAAEGMRGVRNGPLAEMYAAWAGKDLTDEEADTFGRLYAQAPEEMRNLNTFVRRLQAEAGHHYKKDEFANYLKLAAVPGIVELVVELQQASTYRFGPQDASALIPLAEHRELVVGFLRETGIAFSVEHSGVLALMVGHQDRFRAIHAAQGAEARNRIIEACLKSPLSDYLREHADRFDDIVSVLEETHRGFSSEYDLANLSVIIGRNAEKICAVSPEKRPAYVEISLKIDNSPSQEIQRIKDQLIRELLENPDPSAAYARVEQIFIKNNLPTVGKTFKIFETLYPPQNLEYRLGNDKTSPVLKGMKSKRKYLTLYRDLLRCHIESGNRSLRDYAAVLFEGQQYLDKAETLGWESLESEERERLTYILKKFDTLLRNSALDSKDAPPASEADSRAVYDNLRKSLGAAEGQTISDRVAEMYLRPAGLESLKGLLKAMDKAKADAHDRNVGLVEAAGGKLSVRPGDMFKGVDIQYAPLIFQNGSVAKEFLGAGAKEDSTPMDTDVAVVQEADVANGFAGALDASMAKGYATGGLVFCVRDRGQFQKTVPGEPARFESGKLELFQTGTGQHHGIRTGFPATQIDFMVALPELADDRRKLENLYFEIAQNDFYVPVVDSEGTIVFTPERYREFRNIFAGLERFGNKHLSVDVAGPGDRTYGDVRTIIEGSAETRAEVAEIGSTIRRSISDALVAMGIRLKPEYDTSILGAELVDTGSTGRATNLPDSFDFDFSLKLDSRDMKRLPEVAESLRGRFAFESQIGADARADYIQLRLVGVTRIGDIALPRPVDIDIGVGSKAELKQFETQDALREKLDYVRRRDGAVAYENALANILLAKNVLKDAHAYKKASSVGGEGGFAGVGTETWVLANRGSALRAFESFRKAARGEDGERLPLEEFKRRYRIFDAGINIKKRRHDNFVELLTDEGYSKMLDAIEAYLDGKAGQES